MEYGHIFDSKSKWHMKEIFRDMTHPGRPSLPLTVTIKPNLKQIRYSG